MELLLNGRFSGHLEGFQKPLYSSCVGVLTLILVKNHVSQQKIFEFRPSAQTNSSFRNLAH